MTRVDHSRARITMSGRNSINPPAPMTPWARERRDGPILPMIEPRRTLGQVLAVLVCWARPVRREQAK